jgi:hypothetical protein
MCYKRKDRAFAQGLAAKIDGLEAVMEKLTEGKSKYKISTCSNCGCENVRLPGDVQDCWFCSETYLDKSPVGSTLDRRANAVSRKQI